MMRPALAVRRCDMADLARDQPQPAAMERSPEWNRDQGVAIPAQLEHGRLETSKRQRGRKAGRRSAGVDDKVAIGRRRFRRCKTYAKLLRQLRARRIDIDECHLRSSKPPAQKGD